MPEMLATGMLTGDGGGGFGPIGSGPPPSGGFEARSSPYGGGGAPIGMPPMGGAPFGMPPVASGALNKSGMPLPPGGMAGAPPAPMMAPPMGLMPQPGLGPAIGDIRTMPSMPALLPIANAGALSSPETILPAAGMPGDGAGSAGGDFADNGERYNYDGLAIRPGMQKCGAYMRSGRCAYGPACKFDHPEGLGGLLGGSKNIGEFPGGLAGASLCEGEMPRRHGKPQCPFLLRTGTCPFGPECKFDHDKFNVPPPIVEPKEGEEKPSPPQGGLPAFKPAATAPKKKDSGLGGQRGRRTFAGQQGQAQDQRRGPATFGSFGKGR